MWLVGSMCAVWMAAAAAVHAVLCLLLLLLVLEGHAQLVVTSCLLQACITGAARAIYLLSLMMPHSMVLHVLCSSKRHQWHLLFPFHCLAR